MKDIFFKINLIKIKQLVLLKVMMMTKKINFIIILNVNILSFYFRKTILFDYCNNLNIDVIEYSKIKVFLYL